MSVVQPFPVEKEYGKNPDISRDDVHKLREWLKTQPHLPGEHLTELDLVIVYHCCERSAEVSKQVLDLHFTLRTLFAPFFKDRALDKKTDLAFDTVLYAPLPTPTVHGYRAVYLRLLDPDPRNFMFVECVRTFMMMFDLWQQEEGTWPGFVIMIDMDRATMSHVAKLDIMAVRQVLYFLQECMLVKLKEVHFLNAPVFMDKVMMMLKPFMKKALLDMIRIHQAKAPELYQYIPKEAFPKEEGGEYKDHATIRDELIKRLYANKQFFVDENKRRVDQSKRPGKATTVEDLFGIQGSFKKLDID
ncbi:alpha-tocopherol transfer protein-like [Pectinophora gossypiella]|uniref:alpha-tocopherol transfer protein-like n=1 Tax=Pectinophora gossypiella TaxID=13191 RepID=UPI00214F5605|nr:alpha-tocopherol transfer protein-like [Pectinophora gossypiella]